MKCKQNKKNTTKSSVLFLFFPTRLIPFFCSTVHNAHNSAPPSRVLFVPLSTMHTHTHNPSMVHNAHTYAQPWPPSQVQHTCHNVPASICSPAFFQEASTKEIYPLKKKNQCVCKNALERERGYTHTCQGNMVMAFFFFFFSLFCFRVLQSKSSHIPMTFFGGETYHFSYSHQTNNVLNFF